MAIKATYTATPTRIRCRKVGLAIDLIWRKKLFSELDVIRVELMESRFNAVKKRLLEDPQVWLITGVAGFIGSNLLEVLLELNQTVVGLDNFATGHRSNLDEVEALVGAEQWARFRFIEGDICNLDTCRSVTNGVQYVLHQAALGSVPRSINDPIASNKANIDGFLNMLVAARDAKVKKFVYAASSSTYGDHPSLPKVEDVIGKPLSPYAVTKYVNELYADVFARTYGFNVVGLRYFNVFGQRQDPDGAYAAVIPKWISSFLSGSPIFINGDGSTSRDFCYIKNVVQANLLAAQVDLKERSAQVFNVAVGDRTSLLELYENIRDVLRADIPNQALAAPEFRDFRSGDVRHSLADISKASSMLGYSPTHKVKDGLKDAASWYVKRLKRVGGEKAE